MNGLALCAGYGGLELGIKRVFPQYRSVCYVEGECFVVNHIIKKIQEGKMDDAPVWSNVITFDGSKWRGKVDIITGGFPCQPFSYAGKQEGTNDSRHLWPSINRIIGEIRPKYLFFENVPGVVKHAMPEILKDLFKLGYEAWWGIFRVCDVMAPHRRSRWFLWAEIRNTDSNRFKEFTDEENYTGFIKERIMERSKFERFCKINTAPKCQRWNQNEFETSGREFNVKRPCYEFNSHPNCFKWRTDKREPHTKSNRWNDIKRVGQDVSNSNRNRFNFTNTFKESIEFIIKKPNGFIEIEGGLQIIPDTNGSRNKRIQSKIFNDKEKRGKENGRNFDQESVFRREFVNHWQIEPSVGRLVDGSAQWVDKLRLLGNGVVPQQAEFALITLLRIKEETK